MNATTSETMMDQRNPSAAVERKLVGAWRRKRIFVSLRGAFHVCIWIAVIFAVDFAIDWTLNLSGTGRLILLAVNLLILAVVIYLRWLRHVRRYDPLRTALEVETCYPQLKTVLVSYVQLRNRDDQDPGMSVSLIQAMCGQAATVTTPIDFGKVVRFRTLKPLFIACFVVLLVGGLAIWSGNELVEVFLGRMFNPTSNLRYPTDTLFEPVTQDAVIQEGRTFSPKALAGGEIPKEAVLTIRPLDGETETVVIPAGKENRTDGKRAFTYHMGEVYRSFTYYFRIGDAVSDSYTVTVVPPPRAKATVTVSYPTYTNRQPNSTTSLTMELLEGSQIEWLFEFDRPLASAEMIQGGEKTVPLVLQDDGLATRMALGGQGEPLTRSLNYSFRWKDAEHGFTYSPAAQYMIQVVPDRSPRVALVSPSRDLSGTIQKVLDIRVSASDDYGLSSASVIFSVDNDSTTGKGSIAETPVPIKTEVFKDQPVDATLSFNWPLLTSIPDLAPGDVVHYSVELTDNRPGKPLTTRSEMRRMAIVTPGEYVDYVAKQRARLLAQIRELQAVERKASDSLDDELRALDAEKEKTKN